MKVSTIFAICLLFVGVFATADPEITSIVSNMEKSKYGKTLLDTIAL